MRTESPPKEKVQRNKKEYSRFSDHIGLIPLVLVSPSDSLLIAGGSEERRKFMDMVISQYDRGYLDALIRYNKGCQPAQHSVEVGRLNRMKS